MLIRQANVKDGEAIARLSGQLGYPTSSQEANQRLEAILPLTDHAVYVAENPPGSIIGWIQVHGTHHLQAEPYAEIGGLVVESDCQGEGIGKALVSQAQAWAESEGYRILRVRTNRIRLGAFEFYQRVGFELHKSQHVFVKSIEPNP